MKLSSVIPSEFILVLVLFLIYKRKRKTSNYFDVYHEQQQQSLQMCI